MKITFSAGRRVQTNGTADFFRLLSTVNPVTVEFYYQGREIAERVDVEGGFAEQFRTIEFDRVDIFSATAQTVQWETALGSEIRYDRGAATVNGSVDLNTATQNALIRPTECSGRWGHSAVQAANTEIQLFTPGSNVNGVILLSASISASETSVGTQSFLSKAGAAPATAIDGDVYMMLATTSAGTQENLQEKQFIPAGHGLYWISSVTTTVQNYNHRAARWRVL